MYHVTRCPNCRTSFRVTDAHLTAFDGKVRCGRCAFVFDARTHFVGDAQKEAIKSAVTETPVSAEPAQPPAPQEQVHAEAAGHGLVNMASMLETADKPDTEDQLPAAVHPKLQHASIPPITPEPAQYKSGNLGKREPTLGFPTLEGLDTSPGKFPPTPTPAPAATPPAASPTAPPEDEPAEPAEQEEQTIEITAVGSNDDISPEAFERWTQHVNQETEARLSAALAPTLVPASAAMVTSHTVRPEHPHDYRPILTEEDEALLRVPNAPSPWRWLWSIPALLALIALIGQFTLRYRTEIAVQLPGIEPKLERFCAQVGCTLELPARAELLRTEWNELTYVADHSSLIQLNATLRNQASFAQALPLLELTLTDDNDRIVARKVFNPDQYIAPQADGQPAPLPTSLGAGTDLRVFLQLDLGTMKSSGYSLYWFYPQSN
ncbi:DUF3426 domain-containing protein [Chitinimonas sp. BJB300]|uniref:DUF3426 domain-containing protein n=1 Tax=Chitinimonas sp. BJB300 TaxID=1559339 RepID=UPI000C0E1EB0|nr:DUF3426 domain-containing protein [Chitinimonas sp. BJB300]PHV11595.1 hypothetical protein CSQ89_10040 [Chitinimonas sp. BJB300]TSJ88083.1 DUF3426 domain-containing protein [Chitinimonas sp. BJB300]